MDINALSTKLAATEIFVLQVGLVLGTLLFMAGYLKKHIQDLFRRGAKRRR